MRQLGLCMICFIPGVFSRHNAVKAAQKLDLPYRKPFEWLPPAKAWELLDCPFMDFLALLLGEQTSLRGVYIGSMVTEMFSDIHALLDEYQKIRVHPDYVRLTVKKRQQKFINKEKALLRKMLKEGQTKGDL